MLALCTHCRFETIRSPVSSKCTLGLRRTAQSERADHRQQRNAAGGYAFVLDDAARLRRFLTLGVDGGTYYAAPRELARENAEIVARMAQADPETLVRTIVEAMTALPSIVAGLLIYASVIVGLGVDKSGFAASLAISVMMLPIMIRSATAPHPGRSTPP